jgi:hypothetical protein
LKELQRLEALLKEQQEDFRSQLQLSKAQHILLEQTLQELQERREGEEERLQVATQNLQEVETQAQRVIVDAKTVKEAFMANLATSHAELAKVHIQIQDRQRALQALEQSVAALGQEEQYTRQLAEEQVAQQVQHLQGLEEKMEDIHNEMLRDKEAIVEQRREHEELVQRMQEDELQWEGAKHERLQRQQDEHELQTIHHHKTLDDHVSNAKQELLALGNFLTSQKDATANKYEEQLHQLERMQDKVQRATEQYQSNKEQLDLDIAEYATKRQDLDKLIGRLDRSEKQYHERQEELEWEVARLYVPTEFVGMSLAAKETSWQVLKKVKHTEYFSD